MAKYSVYGDYGYVSQCLLYEDNDRSSAIAWAERYIRGGDFGGYNLIEVAYFADEEYVPVMVFRQEDYVDEDDDFLVDL